MNPAIHPAMNPDDPSHTGAFDEETARAEVYGLLAQLFYAPPPPALLEALRVAVTDAPAAGGFLEEPWRAFVGAARAVSDREAAQEYEALFGGVGKPEVYLFGSHYLSGYLNEKPLARLRGDLAQLGLARQESMAETEDHIAYLCEVMRYLIAGEGAAAAGAGAGGDPAGRAVAAAGDEDDAVLADSLARQRDFFAAHLQPWAAAMCEAIASHPRAHLYAALAGFTRAFLSVEAQGFDMLDGA